MSARSVPLGALRAQCHAHAAAAVANLRHIEYFHDHQRMGVKFRSADAEKYRQD